MKTLNCLLEEKATYLDLLSCLFGLNDLEMEIMSILQDGSRKTLDEISALSGRNRSTAFKALEKLTSLGFVNRYSEPLRKGGRYSMYYASETEKLRSIVNSRKEEICSSFDHLMNQMVNLKDPEK